MGEKADLREKNSRIKTNARQKKYNDSKRSELAVLLSDIRKEKAYLSNLAGKRNDLKKSVQGLSELVRTKQCVSGMTLLQTDLLKLTNIRRLRVVEGQIVRCERRLEVHEEKLAAVKAVDVVKAAKAANGDLEPGWRHVKGHEHRFVWDNRGRVGILTKNVLGSMWTIRLLAPCKRGVFQLSIGGGDYVRLSFSTIAQDSKSEPLVARNIDFGGLWSMDAVMVEDGARVVIWSSRVGR